jgi:hypothetical protein
MHLFFNPRPERDTSIPTRQIAEDMRKEDFIPTTKGNVCALDISTGPTKSVSIEVEIIVLNIMPICRIVERVAFATPKYLLSTEAINALVLGVLNNA